MISFLGVGLIALWTLSPVGGQASIRSDSMHQHVRYSKTYIDPNHSRQLEIGTKMTTESVVFRSMVHNGNVNVFQNSDRAGPLEIGNTLFFAALMATPKTRMSPQDIGGNSKIPRIERYEKAGTYVVDEDGWYATNRDDNDLADYASLVGIPIAGINASATSSDHNLRIQTPYFNTECVYIAVDRLNGSTGLTDLPNNVSRVTGTGAFIWWSLKETSKRALLPPAKLKPYQFTYVSISGPNATLQCDATSTYVETETSCAANSTCRATRIRRSRLEQFQSGWTLLDKFTQGWYLFVESLMQSTKRLSARGTLLDRYLADPVLALSGSYTDYLVNMTDELSNEEYSTRLTQLWNSYFPVMSGMFAVTGRVDNDTSYFWDTNVTFVPPFVKVQGHEDEYLGYNFTSDGYKARFWPSQGTKTLHTEVIIAHQGWVAVLCATSIVLILATIGSMFIHHFLIKSPDVGMNISSLATRDNPNIPLPGTGTYMDASTRARLLRDGKVQFGDVSSEAEYGSLAIRSFQAGGEANVERIRKGRLYG